MLYVYQISACYLFKFYNRRVSILFIQFLLKLVKFIKKGVVYITTMGVVQFGQG